MTKEKKYHFIHYETIFRINKLKNWINKLILGSVINTLMIESYYVSPCTFHEISKKRIEIDRSTSNFRIQFPIFSFDTSAFVPIYFPHFLHNRRHSSLIKTASSMACVQIILNLFTVLALLWHRYLFSGILSMFNFQKDAMRKKYAIFFIGREDRLSRPCERISTSLDFSYLCRVFEKISKCLKTFLTFLFNTVTE